MSLLRQRMIGALLVAVLAATPLGGAVCAAACKATPHPAAAGAGAQGGASMCHEAPSAGAVLGAASGHDCSRHDPLAADVLAPVTPTRAQASPVGLAPYLTPAAPPGIAAPSRPAASAAPDLRTASPPRTSTSLPLRI